MLYLIRRDQRDAKSANLADWTENLNAVYFYEPGTSQVCIETFKKRFHCFPLLGMSRGTLDCIPMTTVRQSLFFLR